MKKILIVTICIVLMGCGKTHSDRVVDAYFDAALNDPSTLEIYSRKVIEVDDKTTKYDIDYGFKNSEGTHVRETIQLVVNSAVDNMIYVNGEVQDINSIKTRRLGNELIIRKAKGEISEEEYETKMSQLLSELKNSK